MSDHDWYREALTAFADKLQGLASGGSGGEMHIFWQEAGVISKEPVWICYCGCYMYIADTPLALIEVMNAEWEHDKHIVGY